MPLEPGARLGPYEVIAFVGEGGMGEVYRARDTRLDRIVAIKILPAPVAADPERRLRFEREARAIAALSHPHVCALHDVGSEYLVMEFLDGETLADRLARGPLSIDDVVRYGGQIASALDAAHRHRIVHRDLKPGNVMLTRSGVKLMDFGLAKAIELPSPDGQAMLSTMSVATKPGMVLGTLPYMAPEQIEGRDTDARADIFALGAVLYEMAAGHRAFRGDSAASLASSILAADPPPIAASPALDAIVRGCLFKDPDDRWQSAHDVALQLRQVPERDRRAALAARSRHTTLPWIVAAAALAAAVAGVAWAWRVRSIPVTNAIETSRVAFAVPMPSPDGYAFADAERRSLAISKDGAVAFPGGIGEDRPAVWVRLQGSETAVRLAGTDGANSVFWSPDGKTIGFFADGTLKRVDAAGGVPVTICRTPERIGLAGTWGDGQILFASVQGDQIFRVAASGGTAVEIVRPDPSKGEVRTLWPTFLPDGRRFLYLSVRAADSALMLGGAGGAAREIVKARSNAGYVDPGFLVYSEDGALIARRFDAETGAVTGGPVAIAPAVTYFRPTGLAQFDTASNGAIVYRDGADVSRIVVSDRQGRETSVVRGAENALSIRLSHDGRELYLDRRQRPGTISIWRIELDRGAETRVTGDAETQFDSNLLSDGSMVFSTTIGWSPKLMLRPPSGPDVPLAPGPPGMQNGSDVSADGKWVVYSQRAERGNFDVMAVSLADRTLVPFQHSDANEEDARFSPDGRLVVFESDISGHRDVHVAPFPGPGRARIVSTIPGALPRWSRNGREIFYIGADGTVFAVPIATGPSLQIGSPVALFTRGSRARWTSYEPTSDGGFIALEPRSYAAEQPLHVLLNWRPGS